MVSGAVVEVEVERAGLDTVEVLPCCCAAVDVLAVDVGSGVGGVVGGVVLSAPELDCTSPGAAVVEVVPDPGLKGTEPRRQDDGMVLRAVL